MALRRSTIRKAVSAAFKALGELVTPCTYRRTVSAYTPGTGGMVKTNTDYPISAVFTSFSQFEVDRVNVLATDQKMLVKVVDLAVLPQTATDTVILGSKTFNIIRYIIDPSNSLYTIHLRAP